MKNIFSLTGRIICSAFFVSFFFHSASAQTGNAPISKVEWADENIYRAQMKKDGIPADAIEKLVESRKEIILQNKKIVPGQPARLFAPPAVNASCSDMGGETGWGAWVARTGDYSGGVVTWGAPITPTAPRFNLTSSPSIDACTPGPAPGSPPIPVVSPGFGNASIQLGQIQTNGASGGCGGGGCVEEISYPLTVTAQDSNFVFSYAVVIEDPSHSVIDQPFVSLCIKDSNGNPVPCGCFTYTAGPSIPGFYQSACNVNSVSYYKPWTMVGVNLSAYIGQTLTVVITNADCGLSGHFAQSYWDFSCNGNLYASSSSFQYCSGATSVQVDAPYETGYTYNWSTGQTTSSITVNPQITDTVIVQVIPPSGCGYYLTYVLQPTIISPGFSFSGTNCSSVYFADTSLITGGTLSSWNWSFPGGTPSSSTLQNPGSIIYPAGTYIVTLNVTSQAGCTAAVTNTITIAPVLTLFSGSTNASCSLCSDGSAIIFPSGGNKPYTYNWAPVWQSTQTASGLLPGTYTVCVTDVIGCSSCDSVTVGFTNGVNNNYQDISLVAFPNPSAGEISILINSNSYAGKTLKLKLFDAEGKVAFTTDCVCNNACTVSKGTLPAGTYFYRISDKETLVGKGKLVIQ